MTSLGRQLTIVVAVLAGLAGPAGTAAAQDRPAEPPNADRQPLLAIGLAAGNSYGESGNAFTISLQFPIARHLRLESDTTLLRPGRFGLRTWMSGANLVFRAGTSRVAGFVGAGLGFQHTTGGCCSLEQTSGLVGQVIGGVDVRAARRLVVFASLRGGTAPEDGVRLMGGLRFEAGTRQFVTPQGSPESARDRVSQAVGKTVRVTTANGLSTTGTLVSLDTSTVVIRRRGTDLPMALATVQKVEKVSHGLRNGLLIGAAASAVPWVSVATTRDSCADCEDGPAMAGVLTLVALGAGAGIGAIANAARAGGNVVYRGQPPPPALTLAPIVSATHRGVAARIRW
jgi:hypothetical protein